MRAPERPRIALALALVSALLASFVVQGCKGCSAATDGKPYYGTTSRHGKDPNTFYVNAGGEPEYIDPGMAHDTASSALVNSLFEGLAAYGPDALPRPGVAASWDESADHRLFRFHLRPDAKWTDGKQVTAHDFVYAWKRALSPALASQAASNLYSLINAEAYNLGRLKTTKAKTTVRTAPSSDGDVVMELEPSQPLDVLIRSPMKVASAVAPWTEAPSVKVLLYDPADPKAEAPERMRVDGEDRAITPDAGWNGKVVKVIERLGPVTCNDASDFFYRVRDGQRDAILPGCALGDASSEKDGFLLVSKHLRVPTYSAASSQPDVDPIAIGFVPEADVASDPSVLGVRAIDDVTLEVELKSPTPYFIDLVCHSTLYPVREDVIEKWEKLGKGDLWTRPENIVSNGPYMLDQWKFRYEITMKRNPHYYDHDKLKIHRIVWLEVEEYTATMNLYEAGEIDYIGDSLTLPPDSLRDLPAKKDFLRSDYLGTYWYEFNTKTPPTDNALVRRALDLAIDKQLIVDNVTLAGQKPATHFVPDFISLGYDKHVDALRAKGADRFDSPDYRYNPEKARALLKEAGYTVVPEGDGFRADGFPQLELLYNTSEGHKKLAVAIQDQWKRNLGVSVTLRNEEWKVMLKTVRDRNFQVVRFGWIADYNHARTFLDTFLSYSPNNRTGWNNPKFDDLMKRAEETSDVAESISLYREAEEIAVDAMPKMPIYFYTKVTLKKPYVKGFVFNTRNTQLIKYMWIDPDWEKDPTSNDVAYAVADFPAAGVF